MSLYTPGIKCSFCKVSGTSQAEKELALWVRNLGFDIKQNTRSLCLSGKEIDIYIPSVNLGIEYCGLYWHNEFTKDKFYHAKKYEELNGKGIQLLTIFEDEYLEKPEIVRSIIASKLRVFEKTVYARSCSSYKIDPKTFRPFFAENHLQGAPATTTSHCFGLYHQDELVMAMSLGVGHRQNFSKENLFIDRVCVKKNTSVIGGATKLMKETKAFAKSLGYSNLKTYSDRRYSNGHLYKSMGFEHGGFVPADYSYVKGAKRRSKQSLRLKDGEKNLKNDEGEKLTEGELRLIQGWTRIWDCGKDIWILKI